MTCAVLALAASFGLTLSKEFVFRTQDPAVKSVHVAGSFNGWNFAENPLTQVDPQTWRIVLNLRPGRHEYKFVVNKTLWVLDPTAGTTKDGAGHENSVCVVMPNDFEKPAKRGDGVIARSVTRFSPQDGGTNFDQGRLTIRCTARPNDVESITIITSAGQRIPMRQTSIDGIAANYAGSFSFKRTSTLRYGIECKDGATTAYFTPDGLSTDPKNRYAYSVTPKSNLGPVVPSWVEDSVLYQIFPDRFANGSKANDPKYVSDWSKSPTYLTRFGGDAVGIEKHVGYLRDLGIDTIYLNPIMKAPSYHRYDPVDFYKVDAEFGTNDEFIHLTKTLKKAGISTVLDQIFDHVGTTFPPFEDLLKNQQKSKYKDYFFVKSWPVEVRPNPPYEGWYNVESMPKVNLAQPELRKYLLGSVDFWMSKAELKGWRLDVASEVPQWFWREFRTRVKANDKQAWIVGEVMADARTWLQGDQWDASMNYPFRFACLDFFATKKTTASQFMNQLMTVYDWYAPQVSRNQMNLISSHDTPRFLHEVGNDERIQRLAAVLQFTWPGVPSVYYGEELGMQGAHDPDNRRPMRWDLVSPKNAMLRAYKQLIQIRKANPVFRKGSPVALASNDQKSVAAFGRIWGSERAIVLINRSEKEQTVEIPVQQMGRMDSIKDALGSQSISIRRGTVRATLRPMSAIIGLAKVAGRKVSLNHSNHLLEAQTTS